MNGNDIITPEIRKAIQAGARQLRRECDGLSDAMDYLSDLCYDVCADLKLADWEYDDEKERALRDAAREAIHEAFR